MPITTSAKKALRSSKRKRVFNLARKRTANEVVKKFKKLISDKSMKDAAKLYPELQKALDKGVKTGIMKLGAASRKKARFVKMLKKTI